MIGHCLKGFTAVKHNTSGLFYVIKYTAEVLLYSNWSFIRRFKGFTAEKHNTSGEFM